MNKITKILIVDDDATVRKLIKGTLRDSSREFLEASNPLDGLHLAQSELPDLVLLDLGMPGFYSGFSLFEAMKGLIPFKRIQIVIVTGWNTDENIKHARNIGADGYVIKPFSPDKLLNLVCSLESKVAQMPVIVPDQPTRQSTGSKEIRTKVKGFLRIG